MEVKDLGFKLRKLREEKGVSQQTLAIDLGISQSKVSKIENGTEKITVSYFIKILTYFSLSSQEIIDFFKSIVDSSPFKD
ncbi:helix-turn-helix transcriptional regulator [uncultured Chryseobacterium sp.]|uniref:helix-turn-helix domain-containing protein n=1 Tax=uncultured Chryseobacterium sp. TaxID=259322 RepID=UPI0025FA08E9|nr:helix-turn-helix transcriptional regulator [uncultured Chryseobacterium sp.]